MAVESLVQAIQSFIQMYGLLAVFVYLALETGMILHFAPSELVVPFAAAELVHGPLSFIVFVLVSTAGATVGALFPYAIFRRYGRLALDRYGRYVQISSEDVDRGERWFRRWGESSVLWGRVLPFVRAYISIPAGLAEMDVRKYTIYSAIGAGAYNLLITYLVYTGESTGSPINRLWIQATQSLIRELAYLHAHLLLSIGLGIAAVVIAGWLWWKREAIRAAPILYLHRLLLVLVGVGFVSSTGFLLGGLISPEASYHALTSVWNDPEFFVAYGASPQLALLITSALGFLATTCLYVLDRVLSSIEIGVILTQRFLYRNTP